MYPNRLPSRRDFVRTATVGAAATLGDLTFLARIPAVSAEEMKLDPNAIRFDSGIEPLVRLLEETPRDRLLEEFAAHIAKGTSYKEVLAALMLAGIRNIPPRPDVGWKFHAVLCLNSAHLASMASPPKDRWLPIFYALDFFKGQQMYDERESDWSLGRVKESSIPPAHKSKAAFNQAMDNWDDGAADAATAGLVRTAGATEVFERFAYYGMRDFRNIGHKEIYTANSWRTLQCIGWRYAEPIMRSLTYALLNHHEEPNPAHSELDADGPWRKNVGLVKQVRSNWLDGEIQSGATVDLLSTMRTGTWSEASEHVLNLLNSNVSPQSIRDALFTGAAELLARQPSIYSLHAVTATNAMDYAFRTTGNDDTRRLLLLQNAAFLPKFRDFLKTLGKVKTVQLDELKPSGMKLTGKEALDEIFQQVNNDPVDASTKVLAYVKKKDQSAESFMNAARRLVFQKTRNSHDYKFSCAVMEDYYQISPEWRDRYLAASVYYLPGTSDKDNQLVQRTRAALS